MTAGFYEDVAPCRLPCTIVDMQWFKRCRGVSVVAALTGLCHGPGWAAGQLRCDVTYAGDTRTLVATPVADPYGVGTEDIRGRFRFRAVVVGTSERIDYINLYVYQRQATQAVLVQQAKYLSPFVRPADGGSWPLTGEQRLYAGPMERELIYSCTLQQGRP